VAHRVGSVLERGRRHDEVKILAADWSSDNAKRLSCGKEFWLVSGGRLGANYGQCTVREIIAASS
jgi:hypothetical protein